MLDNFLKEIEELKGFKDKYIYKTKDCQRMSRLLYDYMLKEYVGLSEHDRIEKYINEECRHCRKLGCGCEPPNDVLKPILEELNEFIPARIGCDKFEWS